MLIVWVRSTIGRSQATQALQESETRYRDITQRTQMEQIRQRVNDELEARVEQRTTYTVFHDLKSPLITIRGFLGFFMGKGNLK